MRVAALHRYAIVALLAAGSAALSAAVVTTAPAGAHPAGAVRTGTLPTGTTAVPVTAGATTTGIDATLARAGSIAGKLTAATTGTPVTDAYVQLYDAARHPINEGTYDGNAYLVHVGADGTYRVPALNEGRYYACFLSDAFVDACLGGVNLPSSGALPRGARAVTLGAGQQLTGVGMTLRPGATITGAVRATTNGTDHPQSQVLAVNLSTGDRYRNETVWHTGRYTFTGLSPSAKGYALCFDPAQAEPRSSKVGYLARCYPNVPWTPGTPTPTKAGHVTVRAGQTHRAVNVALPPGAAIAGTVRMRSGAPTSTLIVRVFSATGRVIAQTSSGADGTGRYKVRGLPKAKADHVCVQTSEGIAAGQCWRTVPYGSGRLPRGTANIRTIPGHTHSGIDFALKRSIPVIPVHGTITGTITKANGGAPVDQASVTVYDAAGKRLRNVSPQTDAQGHFSVSVRVGSGYRVCSAGRLVSPVADTPAGLAPSCFGAGWDGVGGPPSAATKLTVKAGATRSGVDIALPDGAAITGHITDGSNHPVFSGVQVFNSAGRFVGSGFEYDALGTGAYKVVGLPADPAGYTVCFSGAAPDLTVPGDLGYLPQCYAARPWDVPVPQAEYGSD